MMTTILEPGELGPLLRLQFLTAMENLDDGGGATPEEIAAICDHLELAGALADAVALYTRNQNEAGNSVSMATVMQGLDAVHAMLMATVTTFPVEDFAQRLAVSRPEMVSMFKAEILTNPFAGHVVDGAPSGDGEPGADHAEAGQ